MFLTYGLNFFNVVKFLGSFSEFFHFIKLSKNACVFSTMEKPTLVNFKHFMFKMVEPPLKEDKERKKSCANLERESEKMDGVNLWLCF